MRFEYKKLPKHWQYVLAKRDIKQFLSEIESDIRVVEFLGTGSKPSEIKLRSFQAGDIDAYPLDNEWCYRLRFWGLPEQYLSEKKQLSEYFINDIRSFINACTQSDTSSHPSQLNRIFFLRLIENRLTPGFSTKKVEGIWKIWAQGDPWWQ